MAHRSSQQCADTHAGAAAEKGLRVQGSWGEASLVVAGLEGGLESPVSLAAEAVETVVRLVAGAAGPGSGKITGGQGRRCGQRGVLVDEVDARCLYYDNDNVLRLLYDGPGPDTSSIYCPSPEYTVFGNARTNYNISRIGVLDDTGVFFSSDNLVVEASDLGPGIKRRLTIDQDGNLRIYSLNTPIGGWTVSWEVVQQPCSTHGLCGGNAICEYQTSLRCSCLPGYEMRRRSFKFVELQHTDFYGYDLGYNSSVTFERCKKMCLEMCSCAAFSYRLAGTGVCYPKGMLFNGYTSPDFPGSIHLKVPYNFDTSATSVYARSTAGLACNPKIVPDPVVFVGSQDNKWPYLFAFAGVLGVLDLLFIAIAWWFLRGKQRTPSSLDAGYTMLRGQFRRFTYRELKAATGNFKEELGRGGSGVVYRGVLDQGKVVAVKKLANVEQGDEEFWAEMTVIGRINHVKLVRTWGFCSEGKHKMLVYEYVENESLDRHLFDMGRRPLPWNECLEWVIHCDVKTENILVTREFHAKIADFGLAKLSKRDGSGVQFSHMRGTLGYMAPEWALKA
uniref:non-specific serine/threonine protein kinase n=1 Tax=Setaria viridis TaxID=4556 RepID=A0A4U6UI85_SETVI|nr:hypothetical protein SEVIR_5G268000v2 [Setaria viridis]